MLKALGMVLFAIFHGYFAAWLAVWMLFYPRQAKVFKGFRIPFTPGLIPSSRGILEEAIAESVASNLLRPEVLRESAIHQGLPKLIRGLLPDHIEMLSKDPEFQETLSQGISEGIKESLRSKKNGVKSDIQQKAIVPFIQSSSFTFDSIIAPIWKHLEDAVNVACQSDRFRSAMQNAIHHVTEGLRSDSSSMAMKVEVISGRILEASVMALDLRSVVLNRLRSLTNEELEMLVTKAAGDQLAAIKRVAAFIGVAFGVLSILLFH